MIVAGGRTPVRPSQRTRLASEQDFVGSRAPGDGQKLLRTRTFASGATHARAAKPRRSAEIRRRSRTCGRAPTGRGDAVSRAVEQFAGAVVSGRDCNI